MKTHKTLRYSDNGKYYELHIYEIDKCDAECMQIGLDNNVIFFGIISYEHDLSFQNENLATGSFFIPFLPYKSVTQLISRVNEFVDQMYDRFLGKNSEFISNNLHDAATDSEIDKKIPQLKVLAYKYVDEITKIRHIAVGAVNNYKRDQKIIDLNIKTTRLSCRKTDKMHSWASVLAELTNCSTKNSSVCVEKHEILPFEAREVRVPDIFYNNRRIHNQINDVLLLEPENSEFFARHISQNMKKGFARSFSRNFIVYEMKKYRITDEQEIDILVEKMVEAYRSITGMTGTTTIVLQEQISQFVWDVCIGTYANPYILDDSDKQEVETF